MLRIGAGVFFDVLFVELFCHACLTLRVLHEVHHFFEVQGELADEVVRREQLLVEHLDL